MAVRVLIFKDRKEFEHATRLSLNYAHIVAYGSHRSGFFILWKNRLSEIVGVVTAQQLAELIGA